MTQPKKENKWNSEQLNQCQAINSLGTLSDERSLFAYSEDFGHINQQKPCAVFIPSSIPEIQKLLEFSSQNRLPVTIRGKGLSQGGQALPIQDGLTLSMEKMNQVLEQDKEGIWVEANATWSALVEQSLNQGRMPYLMPYNGDISIAGVVSAGGVGAQSFKYGSAIDHIQALEVITASGEVLTLDQSSPLFHFCLGGQGRFAVITKVKVALRPCRSKVKTFYLLYLDPESWLSDLKKLYEKADYIETFASPAMQGAKLNLAKRLPFAQWFYSIHASFEIDETKAFPFPEDLSPWKLLYQQEEPIHSFLHRHDGRFQFMQATGAWNLKHFWYECFVKEATLFPKIETLLASLPLHYAQIFQIVPIRNMKNNNFLMFPEEDRIYAAMILNPGLADALIPSVHQAMQSLDNQFLKAGGKRYLSGFLGEHVDNRYWKTHFADKYHLWSEEKQRYDPSGVFCSLLHQNITKYD